ncbi:unnamed protein product [Fraxinus pennsylvanica]|uniref:Pectate lyase n=1 Tax=Fraxinus pennsylvanica TaxID=56036 RepID=A0AAD2E9U8_9LAMI|nr:unnamed protein product [Fraxinus pennsylvanica]
MFPRTSIFLYCIFVALSSFSITASLQNLTLPHQHPNPEAVVQEVQRRVNVSISRRKTLSDQAQCLTGNPIDDCWRCDPNWAANRQRLADCAIGFGQGALGGKGGQIYVVTDSSDHDTANPTPGTLRHAVIQDVPLWIIFQSNMVIKLKHELIINNYKTIDGRGANVHITGHGCLTLQHISNVIIHSVHIYNCLPSGNTIIRSSPSHAGWRGKSDGDGISISGSRNIWIDHCALSHCTDGLIDAILGSTAITISNNYFSHHDEVMLLGHNDKYLADSGMQVTIAFNHFGEGLVQRMPRCRRGYIHVVTKRVDTEEGEWAGWNWRTDGDILVNGAFFVPSGEVLSTQYAKASSVEPRSADLIDLLTMNAGVIGGPRDNSISMTYGGGAATGATAGGGGGSSGRDDDYFGMIFGNDAAPTKSFPPTIMLSSLLIILSLYIMSNHIGSLSLL